MEFDDLIRQRLRNFIKERNWSVSRFASRYVEAYADAYSKMEAPGTSTARKLIEDASHRLTEREAQVLDSFTGLNLHELWLEEQKRVLLNKTERYISGHQAPHLSSDFDSLTLLEGRIAALEKKPQQMTLDDVISVCRRYVDIKADKPLIIWCDSMLLLDIVRDSLTDTSIKLLMFDSRISDPIDIVHTVASQEQRMIIGINSDDWSMVRLLRKGHDNPLLLFHVKGNSHIIGAMMETPYISNLHPLYANRLKQCLDVHSDWPELFKKEIRACLASPWVQFPRVADARECMRFLTGLYATQREILSDTNPLSQQLERLITIGFPDKWLTDECSRESLLLAMQTYAEWADEHPDFNPKKVKCIEEEDIKYLTMFGRVEMRTADEWKDWLTERYYESFVTPDLPLTLDIVMASERRKISKNSRETALKK